MTHPRRLLGFCVMALVSLALLAGCGGRKAPDSAVVKTPPPEALELELQPGPEIPLPPPLNGRLLVDAREYPWSALGRLNTGGRGFCTGIMIGPDRVLTEAACLYDSRSGRWWPKPDLHFVAGYQRDSYLANSPVAGTQIAPGYNPAGGASLSNLTSNWAVVTLQAAIGLQTGWLGVNWADRGTQAAFSQGRRLLLQAGYRRDLPHAIWVHFGCPPGGGQTLAGASAICAAVPGERPLPQFYFDGGSLKVLGNRYRPAPPSGAGWSQPAAFGGGLGAGGQPPRQSGSAHPLPQQSVDSLLRQLGVLKTPEGSVNKTASRAAIRQFQKDSRLPVTGLPSQALLGDLLESVRRRGR